MRIARFLGTPTMLAPFLASFMTGLLAVLFAVVSVFLMLVILIQKPKGGGLSGAFGGAGGGQSAVFGAKTGDVLTWFTVGAFVVFLCLGVSLVFATRSDATISVDTIETPLGETPATTPLPGTGTIPAPTPGAGDPAESGTPAPTESTGEPEATEEPTTPEPTAEPEAPAEAEPATEPAPAPAAE